MEQNRAETENDSPDHIVFDHIRKLIISGELRSGMKLPSERALTAELGISRGYVRKAINTLEHYGIVKTLPQRGTIVAGIGGKALAGLISSIGELGEDYEAADLIEVRTLLEAHAARAAALHASPEAIGEVVRCHEEFRQKALAGENTLEEDHLFHLSIARASGNPVTISLVSYITPQIIAMNRGFEERDPDRFQRTSEEHERVVRAIRDHDPAAAAAAMEDHMNKSRGRRLPGGKQETA